MLWNFKTNKGVNFARSSNKWLCALRLARLWKYMKGARIRSVGNACMCMHECGSQVGTRSQSVRAIVFSRLRRLNQDRIHGRTNRREQLRPLNCTLTWAIIWQQPVAVAAIFQIIVLDELSEVLRRFRRALLWVILRFYGHVHLPFSFSAIAVDPLF